MDHRAIDINQASPSLARSQPWRPLKPLTVSPLFVIISPKHKVAYWTLVASTVAHTQAELHLAASECMAARSQPAAPSSSSSWILLRRRRRVGLIANYSTPLVGPLHGAGGRGGEVEARPASSPVWLWKNSIKRRAASSPVASLAH